MASLIKLKLSLLLMLITLSIRFSVSSSSSSSSLDMLSWRCNREGYPFLRDLQLQCPTAIVYSSPIEMDGESLDRFLSSTNVYKAILFYASWCPFSRNAQPKFDALASMYPQIMHVKVEQSSALPSVFSRHGIHSVPSILIVNKTTRVQYHGPKSLHSLSDFYQRTTGLEPAVCLTEDQAMSSSETKARGVDSWKDIMSEEPYLVFSLLFVLLKSFLILCPEVVSSVIALWAAYIPRLNLSIFGESRQVLTHALHLFDVKSAFSKLKVSKSRKFHNGARSARVLASLSLGETSSGRP